MPDDAVKNRLEQVLETAPRWLCACDSRCRCLPAPFSVLPPMDDYCAILDDFSKAAKLVVKEGRALLESAGKARKETPRTTILGFSAPFQPHGRISHQGLQKLSGWPCSLVVTGDCGEGVTVTAAITRQGGGDAVKLMNRENDDNLDVRDAAAVALTYVKLNKSRLQSLLGRSEPFMDCLLDPAYKLVVDFPHTALIKSGNSVSDQALGQEAIVWEMIKYVSHVL